MESVKLGEVVHLHIILDAITQTEIVSYESFLGIIFSYIRCPAGR